MAGFGEMLARSAIRYQEACSFVNSTWGSRKDLGEFEYAKKVRNVIKPSASMQKTPITEI
jgi:hypothetical protein